ncbi:AhpD family alkylhydroperoxidase [Micromonospora sp. M71_S20]|uniref:carboxymuconolactone decarboxylase family protein n=1 Tax=Micromonospora sp. M71_S20 TaxID=592872 RepID=UPI000EB0EFBA|nr:carboxymuconolactone decarboxylase family protein [Micromonospora sp. M71_S20]RLK09999.1 AhpD family alkylhydroperoxidase [Micromonospora sp. M71_S20]
MIARRVASSVVQRQVNYVTPVPPGAARGLVDTVYAQVAQEMQLVVPPAQLHSPSPEVLAAYWMVMREPLLPTEPLDRATKEAVAAAVSVANICPYCVDMHSVGLYELSTEHDAEAIVADRLAEITDRRIRDAAEWARTAHQPRTPRPVLPFSERDRPELVGVVVGFHYIARVVNVFLPNFLLPPGLAPRARRRLKRGIGWIMQGTLRDPRAPGRSVGLLPPAPLPAEAGWAAGSPHVAGAMARAYAAFEAAGERAVPPAVRELVAERLDAWRGEETGLSRQWCERLIAPLPEAERAAGRLALLTAFASYQVDKEVVTEFRRHRPGDAALVDAVAWASFAAARRIGAWYAPASSPEPV